MNVSNESKDSNYNKFGLSGFALKIIAILTMLTDHIGAGLFPSQIWLRMVGRLAFPIFAFLICEGFYHTRDIKRYAVRLGIFAIISEIPFNLLHSYYLFDPGAQNIFFTLLIGLSTIYGFNKCACGAGSRADAEQSANGSNKSAFGKNMFDKSVFGKSMFSSYNLLQLIILAAGLLLAQFLRTDYGAFGVAIILIFHFFRDKRKLALFFMATANLLLGLLDFSTGYLPLQALAGLAAIPLLLYNGNKGPSVKYAFYIFYPAHIAVIMGVKYVVFQLPVKIINM